MYNEGFYNGYIKGVEDALELLSDWVDEDTIEYVREKLVVE